MHLGNNNNHALARSVRRCRDRRERWQREGERSMARNLAMIGVLGWLLVTPTLVGVFVGRWLDRLTERAVFWTISLLFLGLCIGCWMAWRWIHRA